MTGYRPLPQTEYPSIADQVMWEIFGLPCDNCRFCDTSFGLKVLPQHEKWCEISTNFDEWSKQEMLQHPDVLRLEDTFSYQNRSCLYLWIEDAEQVREEEYRIGDPRLICHECGNEVRELSEGMCRGCFRIQYPMDRFEVDEEV